MHPHEDKILDSQLKKQKNDLTNEFNAGASQIIEKNSTKINFEKSNNNNEDLVDDSLENLGHECIQVLIIDNDLSVVKVHEKLLNRFMLKTKHVKNGFELNEVLQELIDCK